ncbi:MAG TPA: hypothetical protein QF353_01640 [Gammaproteobacteria bacterium]|nr:hypothetical protein [Gammaproteobacteria bacterium]
MKDTTSKYLSLYACREANDIKIPGCYDSVIVVPIYAEYPHCIDVLDNLPQQHKHHKILVILVINQAKSSPDWVLADNQKLIHHLKSLPLLWKNSSHNIILCEHSRCHILMVDRAVSQPFDEENVGLARKIGSDMALALIQRNTIRTEWIHQTDADVRLPSDYWNIPPTHENKFSALIYPFSHTSLHACQTTLLACQLYELSLRDYRLKLAQAGSKYAYHSIGSTFAISKDAYAKVRGYPLRQAGEDFHILNKLRKVGDFFHPNTQPLLLSARASSRTPFGTGQNIQRILKNHEINSAQIFYHPHIFDYLLSWLNIINSFDLTLDSPQKIQNSMDDYFNKFNIQLDPLLLFKVINSLKLPNSFIKLLKNSNHAEHFKFHCHTHFDALKTLRFIHLFRDQSYPLITLRELLDYSPYHGLSQHLPMAKILSKIMVLDTK